MSDTKCPGCGRADLAAPTPPADREVAEDATGDGLSRWAPAVTKAIASALAEQVAGRIGEAVAAHPTLKGVDAEAVGRAVATACRDPIAAALVSVYAGPVQQALAQAAVTEEVGSP